MRVLVCGGRNFDDWGVVLQTLNQLHKEHKIKFVFHGNARGADSLASRWADSRRSEGVRNCPCPAQWAKFGKSAGQKRNQAMLGNGIDLVIAFAGGAGTADMVKRAKAAGIEVRDIT